MTTQVTVTASASHPLAGVAVVEIEAGLAGSIACKLLADHGATVTKLRSAPPAEAGLHVWDEGKVVRSDRRDLDEALDRTDVVIVGKGVRFDRTPEQSRPGQVVCMISLDGSPGKLADDASDDFLLGLRIGLADDQPGWSSGPSYVVHPIASTGAGLLAAQAVCGELLRRELDQAPAQIETSLLAGAMAMGARASGPGLPAGRRWYPRPNGPFPFYSAYECGDGGWVQLGCIDARFEAAAIEVLRITDPVIREPTTPVPTREADRGIAAEQYRLISETLLTRTRSEWLRLLKDADVPCAPVNQSHEWLSDPQALHNASLNGSDVGVGTGLRLSGPTSRGAGEAARLPKARVSPGVNAPLKGVRVLEIGNLIAGPMCARTLADLGAEVVKLESPRGDLIRQNRSSEFYAINSGKKSISVNLQTEAGRKIGRQLVERSDIIVDNMRPGVADRLGVGWTEASGINPRLVYCQVTGFGTSGPYAHRPGLDPLATALTGMESEQSDAGGRPVYVQGALVDHSAALLATFGVLLALYQGQRAGSGQRVETSLVDAAAMMNKPAVSRSPQHTPSRSQYGPDPYRQLYRTADGWCGLAARTAGARSALRDLVPTDCAEAALAPRLEAVFRTQTTNEWVSQLSEAMEIESVLPGDADTVLHQSWEPLKRMIVEHDHDSVGRVLIAAGWWTFDELPPAPPGPAPALGEHTFEVLAELGYTPSQSLAFASGGIVLRGESSD